jgi:hypothetical protein
MGIRPTSPVILAGGKNQVSAQRVWGRRSRSHATALRAALDAVAASWTIESEAGGCLPDR